MAKLARKLMKEFGVNAGFQQIAQFGSLNAGSIDYTTDVETVQALGNWLTGWFAAVEGGNSPAIEDMNAMCYVFAYQLCYLMQSGVPEWNSATTYYIGSFVTDGAGNLYSSLTDTNLNNAVTDATKWRLFAAASGGADIVSINPAVSSPYTLTTADVGKTFLVNSANGAMVFNLPVAAKNFNFEIKDSGGVSSLNNITVVQHSTETLEALAATYTCLSDFGNWVWGCDGTNWWLVG